MAKQSLCVKVEPAMKAKILIIAGRESRGMADVIRAAALAYIEQHEKKYGKISIEEINQIQLFSTGKEK